MASRKNKIGFWVQNESLYHLAANQFDTDILYCYNCISNTNVTVYVDKVNHFHDGLYKSRENVMSKEKKTELQRLEILRLSNKDSNRITRNCIETALKVLMKNRGFHEITITEIVNRAGVSRTAYYRNYASKEEILRCIVREIVEQFLEDMEAHPPIKNTVSCWMGLLQSLRGHSEFMQILLSANMGDLALDEIQNRLLAPIAEDRILERYNGYFWIGAIFNVAAAWVRNGLQQSTEEMAAICHEIVNNTAGAYSPT